MANVLRLREKTGPSLLIQRLESAKGDARLVTGPFSAGLLLSELAKERLKDLFTFQYMGASEFEDGIVPDTLHFLTKLAVERKLTAGEYREVFYIAPIPYEEGVHRLIDQLIADEDSLYLLEYCGLANALINRESEKQVIRGWLELDNGFFFFIDPVMFENTKRFLALHS